MPMYRKDRLPGGSYIKYQTTWETEAASTIVDGAAKAAGWVVGSSISGLRTLARNFQDRRMQAAAEAMEAAATAEQFDRLLLLAREFSSHYPGQPLGQVYLSVALTGMGQYDEAIAAVDRAVEQGFDEMEAHAIRVGAYEGSGSVRGLLQEWSALIHNPMARDTALLCRAQVLQQIGDFDQALNDVNQSIASSPDEVAYYIRGNIYKAKGELVKAIDDYARADRIDPGQPHVLKDRADVYDLLGNTEEAQKDRVAAERAAAEVTTSRNQALLDEARALLAYLCEGDVRLKIASNGRDIEVGRARLKTETIATLERLKPQLLQLLTDK